MPLPTSLPMDFSLPAQALPAVINHLLAQEPAACRALAQQAGSNVRIELGRLRLDWQVRGDGLIAPRDSDDSAPPRVTIRINPADVPLILRDRERAFSYVKVAGDAEFANLISRLSKTLRWDVESDLSGLVGDIAAVRLVAAGRALAARGRAGGEKLAENVAEYFLEEQPLLVRPGAVADLSQGVVAIRNDVERLLKRIEKLETRMASLAAPSVKLDSQ